MLRWLVGLLLAANLVFLGWSMGWVDGLLGRTAPTDREPERLAKQMHPERVLLWPAAPSAAAPASAPAPALASASAGLPTGTGVSTPAAAASVAAVAARSPAASAASAVSLAVAPPGPARPAVPSGSAPPPPASAASVLAAAVPLVCLEAGPFNPSELAAATTALRATVPPGSWAQRAGGQAASGDWMIYMGPYPDRDWMERKKRELARIRGGVPQEEITAPPELARGISLGRYPTKAAADAALAQYALRGIRTARVVNSGPGGTPLSYLRVAQANPAVATSLADLKLPPRGARFTACPR